MTGSFNSIRTQLDLIPYGSCQDYMYVKSASFEPCYLSDGLDAVMRLYKEAGFWGNAWDFTKNLGLSTVGLADDKHQWMNWVTPTAMLFIPGVGLAGAAGKAGIAAAGRMATGIGTRLLGKKALQAGVTQGTKQLAKGVARQGAKQVVRRRGVNMATGFKSRLPSSKLPKTEAWVQEINTKVIPNGAQNIMMPARTGVTQGAKNVVSGGVNKGLLGSAKDELRNELAGVGKGWGSSVWNGMNGWQRAGDIAKGVLWGGSRNNAVNWGSWSVPYLASNFTDNKYLNNWATARTNLGYISPGMNRLSGWGANKVRAYRGTPRVPGAKPLVTPPPVPQSPHVQGATTFSSNPSFAVDNPASSTYALQMPLDMNNPRMMAYLEPRWGW